MLYRLIATEENLAATILRWTLAIVIFPHGAQKVLGWFGGYGFSGTLGYFTDTLGIPAFIAILVFAAELLGPIALVTGTLTRFTAASIGIVMLGAIFMGHVQNGFFMNWTGAQAGEGIEYHLLVLGIVAVLLVIGGGSLSVDRKLAAAGS